MLPRSALFLALPVAAQAWQLSNPPAFSPGQTPMFPSADDVDIVSGSQFNGLRTYANLPYVNCFSDVEVKENKYDIAILGAPFDTVRCEEQPPQL